MQISGVSLALTWPLRLCLLKSSPGWTTTATSFPLSKHTGGGDSAPAFSGRHVYLQFTWKVGLPPILWNFPPIATFTSFPAPGCLACAAAPAFSNQLAYLQFHEGFPLSPSLALRVPRPLCYMSFLVVVAYCSVFFFFFPWVGFGPSWGLC
jgi:hypothetical protein